MSDKARFLARLHSGPVSVIDFLAPGVVDGGKPITRLAARKYDLCNDGHDVREIDTAHGCSVYGLFVGGVLVDPDAMVSGVASSPILDTSGADLKTTEAAPETPALFDMPKVYSPWEDAA